MKILYVDDEIAAISRFRYFAEKLDLVDTLRVCDNPLEALAIAGNEDIDAAILDVEMPEMSGIELARKLHEMDANIRIIFITGFHEYAFDAFKVDAVGYLVKPYSMEALQNELDKAQRMGRKQENRVYIQTMPEFNVYVDSKLLLLQQNKQKEMLALMVDRRGRSLSSGEIIAALWEDRPEDDKTKSLVRMTYKRLRDMLHENHIGFILNENAMVRAVNTESFRCDYYELMNGNREEINRYEGCYMMEYDWAEMTNSRIQRYVDDKLQRA